MTFLFLASRLHRGDGEKAALGIVTLGREVDDDTLQMVRLRYKTAYDAYHACAQRLAARLQRGESPTVAEVAEEAQAIDVLTKARHDLMDALERLEGW